METPEESHYNRRYHLQRALKPVLAIDSHKKTIAMPEGLELCKTDRKRVDALVTDYGYVIQATLPIDRFERLVLNGSKGLKGKNIQFRKEMFFTLQQGARVQRIGKRSDSGRYAEDKFTNALIYAGTIYLEGEKHYAFQLAASSLPDKEMHYYLLYQVAGKEIFRVFYKKNGEYSHTVVYRPEFKTVKAARGGKQGKLKF